MTIAPLDVLYWVLAVAVALVGAMLVAVLWQVTVTISTVRSSVLPQVQHLLQDVEHSMTHVDGITGQVEDQVAKLDPAIAAATKAVAAFGDTAVLLNKGVAQPAVVRAAMLVAGVQGAVSHLMERRQERRARAERPTPRPPVMVRE